MRNVAVALVIAALAVGGSAACATKKYVTKQVGDVNNKVDTLSTQVEENQQRTKQNEGHINEVGQRADAANQRAETANQAAQSANSAAMGARSAADAAGAKAAELDRASKRMVYEVVLSEDQGKFKFGKADLPDEVKTRIDEVVARLKGDPKGAYIEIEGHTDSVGPKSLNERIGLERAQAVRQYLYETHQIPLHKMNVISFGEEKPVGNNKTKDGRAQNRRVVIRVLA
ncbi:MAG: OmpA family protein [Acidobacteria bacterium]|nr:OmpA family protein [Acidobacteriota bacterium]